MRTTLLSLFVAVCLSVTAAAQESKELKNEVRELRQHLHQVLQESRTLRDERAALKDRLDTLPVVDSLETQINALVNATMDAPKTVVNSQAEAIEIFGEFRIRWGAAWNRDFGNSDGGVFVSPLMDAQAVNGGQPLESEDDEGTYLEARFIVGFDFQFSKDISTHFVVTSYGLFENGTTSGATGRAGNLFSSSHTLDNVDLYEGWIRIDRVFGVDGLSLTNGRQEIVLGNEFIFGNNEFFSGETFDAARLNLTRDTYTLDFIWAKGAIGEDLNTRDHPYPNVGDSGGFDDDEIYSIYFSYTGITDHVIDLYWVYLNGDAAGTVGTLGNSLGSSSIGDNLKEIGFAQAFFHTFGVHLAGKFDVADGLDYNLEVAYQTGSLKDFSDTDVDGLAIEAELGLTFDAESRARVFVRFLYSEGAHDGDSGYIPLFPERHAYDDGDRGYRARYGLLDIIPMDNVITVQGGFSFDPAADWTVGITVLWATHDADLAPIGNGDDDIGWEIDLFADYRHSDEFTLGLGLGIFLPDEGAPYKNGGFVNNGGETEPAILVYLDARVIF